MDWIKGILFNSDFSCNGSLIKLIDPENNYAKKTEFNSATLVIKKSEIFIKNIEYDPNQDQIEFISFPLNKNTSLVHYSIEDEGVKIESVKWLNLSSKTSYDKYYGFEFEDASLIHSFLSHVSRLVVVDEEGHQLPCETKNLKQVMDSLKLSNSVRPSNITREQVKPSAEDSEEESRTRVQFKRDAISYLSPLYSPDMILYMSSADLYLLGPNLSRPVLTDPGIAFLLIKNSEFNVTMDLVRDQAIFMRMIIDNKFYCFVDSEGQKFSWVEEINQNENRTWRVDLNEDVGSLEALINIARFEAEQQVKVSEMMEDEQNWIKGIHEEVKLEKMQIEMQEGKLFQDEEPEEIFDTVSSWKNSKVFASRKGKVTVFSEEDQQMKSVSVISLPKAASNILLQKQDTRLICLTNDSPNIIYDVDIEKGQIVSEFSLKDKAFIQLAHRSKLSPLTEDETYFGLSFNGIFLVDPRDHNQIVLEYTYSAAPAFKCMGTTEQGHIAVGSESGEIKLYKEIGKRAATTFPNLGEPIKSIDLTKNGHWILATTASCLLVLKAEYEGELAFSKPLSRKKKPARRLTLTPEDLIRYDIGKVDFAPARFNLSENDEENMIITATGNVIVMWNFISVKAGKLFDYCLKPLNQKVVKNEFIFNEENAVITYSNTVIIQNSNWKGRN